MLNIAMLSYHTCPLAVLGGKNTGGMNVYVRELTRHLGMRNIHVDVFTRSENEHVPHVLHDLGYGNRIVHIPAGPEVNLSKEQLEKYLPDFTRGILDFSVSRNLHYDLVHSHYWMSGISGAVLKDTWQVPMVQMFHTLGMIKQSIGRTAEEKEGNDRVSGEMVAIQAADQVIAATPSEKEQLMSLYSCSEGRINVIPPGVNTCHFYPIDKQEAREAVGVSRDGQMILFVGRIVPLKGIDTLIRAMALLKMSCGSCPRQLVIIGGESNSAEVEEAQEMNRLRMLCSELKLDDVILFLGKKGQDTLPYYYSAADLVILPSHYESFGMVALEAMACGTPVIASDVGGLSHLLKNEETGFLVPSQDPLALAECMEKILTDQTLQQRISQQAAAYARKYDWLIITDQVMQVYYKELQLRGGNLHPIR